jgi:hypothetical protein
MCDDLNLAEYHATEANCVYEFLLGNMVDMSEEIAEVIEESFWDLI